MALPCHVAAVFLAAGLVVFSDTAGVASGSTSPLRELESLDDFRRAFNRERGRLRLVLLLSPTCPACVAGARWVQNVLLSDISDDEIRVFAVWFEMVAGDARSTHPEKLIPDRRVVHFWDQRRVIGAWYGARPGYRPRGGVHWDAWIAYGPESVWSEEPSHPLGSGQPVVSSRVRLRRLVMQSLDAGSAGPNQREKPR